MASSLFNQLRNANVSATENFRGSFVGRDRRHIALEQWDRLFAILGCRLGCMDGILVDDRDGSVRANSLASHGAYSFFGRL